MLGFEKEGKRILEVGCGTALTSLLLNKLNFDITATDYHPSASSMLERNVALNGDKAIPFERTGWKDEDSTLGRFDLIIGSDLLYEQDNVQLLAAFIQAHALPRCEVVLVDPGRGLVGRFNKKMDALGYALNKQYVTGDEHIGQNYRGQILQYRRS